MVGGRKNETKSHRVPVPMTDIGTRCLELQAVGSSPTSPAG